MIDTPWQTAAFKGRSPQLLFGRMYEDASIELEAFAAHNRVFCIASAGCTARALAASGHHVTAVDVNPLQIAYAHSRANGGPFRPGAADRLMAACRSLLPLMGWTERRRISFLELENPEEQIHYWDRNLATVRWRAALDALLSPWMLRLFYSGPFSNFPGRKFGESMEARLRRCWANHPNRTNVYAWSLLLRQEPVEHDPPAIPIRFECADAASFLEASPPASFDAFTLSNIADAAPLSYVRRLQAAVQHAAAPNAVVIWRTLTEPAATTQCNLAARDRSALWGSVELIRLRSNQLC